MSISYSRRYKESILRVLIENARSEHPEVVSLDGDLLSRFHDPVKLRGALELLEAQGYVELFRMRSVGIFNVKLTPAGLSYIRFEHRRMGYLATIQLDLDWFTFRVPNCANHSTTPPLFTKNWRPEISHS